MNGNFTVVPQADPRASYLERKREIDEAVTRVLESGGYILGQAVRDFEQAFADHAGVRHGVGVGSGTDAIEIALRALGVGPGDVVFTASHTAVATVAAIERVGAAPALVDVDPLTHVLDPRRLEEAIKDVKANQAGLRPKAVAPVHLYGRPADMPAISDIAARHGLFVVEDCAQAHGAALGDRKVGAWGHLSAFSFYPTKNLGAIGDGGMVLVNDPALHDNLLALRQYGWQERYVSAVPGINSRLDEIQAAILLVKLRGLDGDNARRRAIASRYDRALRSAPATTPSSAAGVTHAFHQYVIQTDARDECMRFLKDRGVMTAIHYPLPVHLQPAYKDRVLIGPGGLRVTERLCRTILSLPMFPQLTEEQVARVCEALEEWGESRTA